MGKIEDTGKTNDKTTNYKTLTLDVEYYQAILDSDDIPEEKKRELIETLWQIVVSFVDLGFGIHPLQQASDGEEAKLHPAVTKMIADAANEDFKNLKEAWPEGSEI